MTYAEKLKDPRWQRKRLEIFSGNDFRCEVCKSDKKTLHAHHLFYRRGAEPWEYEPWQIACLCSGCHKDIHDRKDAGERAAWDGQSARLQAFEMSISDGEKDGFERREFFWHMADLRRKSERRFDRLARSADPRDSSTWPWRKSKSKARHV